MTAIKSLLHHLRSFPLFVFGLCLITFGIMLPFVGFYWDDWPAVLIARQFHVSEFWRYFQDERPLSAWTYQLFAPLLRGNPLGWQAFSLLLRFLVILAYYWMVTTLWPRQKRLAIVSSLLFAVYPVFIQQNQAITYHQLWIQFLLFFLSLGAMLKGIRSARRRGTWLALALITQALGMSISEYFFGAELIRPFLIFMAVDSRAGWKQRLKKTMIYWLPYLAVFVVFIGQWLYFLTHHHFETHSWGEKIGARNRPKLILEMLERPGPAIRDLLQLAFQDSAFILVTSWFKTLNPADINLKRPLWIAIWAIVLAVWAGTYFYLKHLPEDEPEEAPAAGSFTIEWLVVGALLILLGTFPAWSTGRQAIGGLFDNRFAAVAMSGAALILTAGLSAMLKSWRVVAVVAGMLVGLGSGMHLRVANTYRLSWEAQKDFAWQLHWRAPAVKPETLFFGYNLDFEYQVASSKAFSLNLQYALPRGENHQLPYWYNSIYDDIARRLPISRDNPDYRWQYRELSYNVEWPNGLVIYANPGVTRCYWVLQREDTGLLDLPEPVQIALDQSSIDRILPDHGASGNPPREIYGSEPKPNWCTYYQKASLARQFQQWDEIVRLGEAARSDGFWPGKRHANVGFEWVPFIEGYAHAGQVETAAEISQAAFQAAPMYGDALCQTWKKLTNGIQSEEILKANKEIVQAMSCKP